MQHSNHRCSGVLIKIEIIVGPFWQNDMLFIHKKNKAYNVYVTIEALNQYYKQKVNIRGNFILCGLISRKIIFYRKYGILVTSTGTQLLSQGDNIL